MLGTRDGIACQPALGGSCLSRYRIPPITISPFAFRCFEKNGFVWDGQYWQARDLRDPLSQLRKGADTAEVKQKVRNDSDELSRECSCLVCRVKITACPTKLERGVGGGASSNLRG